MTPKPKPRPHIVRLSSIVAKPIEWLVAGLIAIGTLTLLDGKPGVAKSMLAYDLGARVTTGRPLPAGPAREPRDVLVIHPEDHSSILHERIAAADGDPDRMHFLLQAGARSHRPLDLKRDIGRLRNECQEGDFGLVIVENLSLLLGPAANTEGGTRAALHGLAQIAEETDTPILAIRHWTKTPGRQALNAGSGLVALAGTARSVTILAPDPNDPNVRVWASAKSNLGPTPPSLAFEIDDTPHGPAIRWLGTSESSADDLLRTTTHDRAPKLIEAEHMLADLLSNGPRLQADLKAEATRRGIGWRTAETAKANLGIHSRQVPEPGVQGPGRSWWSQPTEDLPAEPRTDPAPPVQILKEHSDDK